MSIIFKSKKRDCKNGIFVNVFNKLLVKKKINIFKKFWSVFLNCASGMKYLHYFIPTLRKIDT